MTKVFVGGVENLLLALVNEGVNLAQPAFAQAVEIAVEGLRITTADPTFSSIAIQ
jgi:hypothetical protein